jgi:cytochrome c oxidase subunit III
MKERPIADFGHLPTYSFGSSATTWWGTLGYIALEGTGFALAAGTLLYLYAVNPHWPLDAPPPDLIPGTIVTVLLLLSLLPNHLIHRWACREELAKVRIGIVVMSLLGVVPTFVRWYEFAGLNVRWDDNAYGSIVWFLLGLHTTHLMTDVGDTIVLAVLMFTRHGASGRRFGDVTDNVFYWDFVVFAWLPIYLLIYWMPRL